MNNARSVPTMRKNLLWLLAALMLASLACNLASLMAKPPTVKILSPPGGIQILARETVEITFLAQGDNDIPFVELTLNSINGQSLASYGSPDAQGQTPLRATLTWTPDKSGEYTLYLTAYDNHGQASVPAALTLSVLPRSTVISSGSKVFQEGDSFDFVTGEYGEYTGGDLFVSRAGPADFSALANNPPQVGGTLLYNTHNTYYGEITDLLFEMKTVREIVADSTLYAFLDADVALELWGVYLYKRHQPPGDYILFIVTGVVDDSVSFDYVVFDMPD